MKISIITAVYNNSEYIESCINSVISQKYSDIEYIIIDGGSTDGTTDIIHRYINNITKYVSEKDNGIYDALNKGLSLATGDLIGILHSDDQFYDEYVLSDIVKKYEDNKFDLVFAKGCYVDKETASKVKRVYSSSQFKRYKLYFGWIPLHTTMFLKKSVSDIVGLYDIKYQISSDYDYSLRLFQRLDLKHEYFNRWVVKMRLGGKSTTIKLQKTKSSEDLEIIKNHNLLSYFTLTMKIIRKIPQYLIPSLYRYNVKII